MSNTNTKKRTDEELLKIIKSIKRIDFKIGCLNSDGEHIGPAEKYVALYNELVISTAEVTQAIRNDTAEYDDRIIIVRKAQADKFCLSEDEED